MIEFSITTPERNLVNEKVDSVTLPTEMGEITVLPNHIPLVANLVPGEVQYKTKGESQYFAVSGGFIEIKKGNKVIVLADTAEFGHEIDVTRAEQAKAEAQKLMQQKGLKSFADVSAALQKNLARIRVAHKHNKTHGRSIETKS